MSRGWCQSLRMEASFLIEYPSIVGFYFPPTLLHKQIQAIRLGKKYHRSDVVFVSVHHIKSLVKLHPQACVVLKVAQSHTRTLRSVQSVCGVVLTSRPALTCTQSLLNGCLLGKHKTSDTSDFTKVKNSLRFGVKWSIQNRLFNYCPFASIEFLFQIKQELGLQIQFAGLYLTRLRN